MPRASSWWKASAPTGWEIEAILVEAHAAGMRRVSDERSALVAQQEGAAAGARQ